MLMLMKQTPNLRLSQKARYHIYQNELFLEPDELVYQPSPAIDLIYEDDTLLIVHKPAGLLVHSDGQQKDTLTARVQAYLIEQGHPYRCQAIQRIDRDTVGLVLFNKIAAIQPTFDLAWQQHQFQKLYVAKIEGKIKPMILTDPIGKDRHHSQKMRISKTGKPATTFVYPLKQQLALIQIMTGRKHQIRVHLSAHGHPIVGDPLYGCGQPLHLVHAAVRGIHPLTNEPIQVMAHLPKWANPSKHSVEAWLHCSTKASSPMEQLAWCAKSTIIPTKR